MEENYLGAPSDRPYRGKNGVITYNIKRCLHAAECTRGLPEVFDTKQRPWIMPDGAPADQIMQVIMLCPSGALHMIPADDSLSEQIPDSNTIYLEKNSYLRVVGNLHIQASGVSIEQETRVALCRCGSSHNKPFCDNSHREIGFIAPDPILHEVEEEDGNYSSPVLWITVSPNGPIEIQGDFEIRDAEKNLLHKGTHTWLCRCGQSANKPFCDTSHKKIGFKAP